jgi:hypothetical protein
MICFAYFAAFFEDSAAASLCCSRTGLIDVFLCEIEIDFHAHLLASNLQSTPRVKSQEQVIALGQAQLPTPLFLESESLQNFIECLCVQGRVIVRGKEHQKIVIALAFVFYDGNPTGFSSLKHTRQRISC